MAKTTRRPRRREAGPVPPKTAPEFPGCKAVHLPRKDLEDFDGRLEYWDGATETAWICEPASPYHEQEAPQSILQADESYYLHPGRARLPGPSAIAMVIGVDDYPDMVLEVDYTTDVRRGKLGLYEAWGFPEVWVEVPDVPSPSRPRGRRPGLTIYLLEDGAYRTAPESLTFPGWTAEEIHAGLNEWTLTEQTSAVLERVGAVLGEREGTGPDHDPLLRSHRRRAFDRGRAEGRAKARAESHALLLRQAARKFGAETAQRLATLLEDADPDRLAQAGIGIIECKTAAEFLDRV